MSARAILHVDMDAFYAAVEQRDRPELAGKPVIVGADPRGRGVVAAASYEARRFGVHSAMPISRAYRLCPHGVYLPVDMAKYVEVSGRIMSILRGYTPLVEPLSLDEAFLDVTASRTLFGAPLEIARTIKAHIRREVRLTASAGVAPNKFLAKVASDLRKPDGLVEVRVGVGAFVREREGGAVSLPELSPSPLEIMAVRRLLEPEAAALASQQMSPEGTVRLAETLRRMRAETAGGEWSSESDRTLHMTLADACGNAVLRETLDALWEIDPQLRCSFMTGGPGTEQTRQWLEQSSIPILAKPFGLEEVVQLVRRLAGGNGASLVQMPDLARS